MKYMLMFCKTSEDDRRFEAMTPEQQRRLFAEVADWQATYRDPVVVDPGYRLARAQAATTVRRKGDKQVVTDGPFVESGEVVGGFCVIDVPDLDEALRIAKAFPACPTCEIRPVLE